VEKYRPAGLLLRRAHNRQPGKGDLPEYATPKHKATIDIELLLRKYGITSVNLVTTITINLTPKGLVAKYGGKTKKLKDKSFEAYLLKLCENKGKSLTFKGVNVQLTQDLETRPLKTTVVDFGHYSIQASFEHPILFLAAYRPLFWGGAMWPEDPRYTQPQQHLAIDPDLWSGASGIFDFPAIKNKNTITILSEGLISAFQNEQITGTQVTQYIRQFVDAAIQPKPI